MLVQQVVDHLNKEKISFRLCIVKGELRDLIINIGGMTNVVSKELV